MRHWVPFLIIVLCCSAEYLYAESHDLFSRSFTIIRPVYDLIEAYHQLVDQMQYNPENSGTPQVMFLYQHSRDHDLAQSKFARYFLFNDKSQLLVAGDDSDLACERDVRAEWLGLNPNFSGYLNICPEHMQYGGLISYHQNLDKIIKHGFFQQSFMSVTIPVVHIRTNLNLNQLAVRNPGTTFPRDIIEAFNQPNWHFDKIAGPQERTAVAEIAVRIGRTFMYDNDNFIVYYSGLIIPAAHKPEPTYLYNAYVGTRYHVGFNGGLNMQIRLNQGTCNPLWAWFVMLDGTYLFKNTQCRTLDLHHKPWSRFLLLTRECTPGITTPGVNVLTREMHVRPYGVFNFASGFRYKNNWYEVELGYNLWGHPQEFLRLEDRFFTEYGILGVSSDPTVAASASQSTIKTQAASDAEFVRIKESDINVYSGAAGSALTHTFMLGFGAHEKIACLEWTFGGGLYTEIEHMNRPVPSWGGWLKVGASF